MHKTKLLKARESMRQESRKGTRIDKTRESFKTTDSIIQENLLRQENCLRQENRFKKRESIT